MRKRRLTTHGPYTNGCGAPSFVINDTGEVRRVRSAGILLHPTSLPGPYGIGDLVPAAMRFVDFLAAADQTYWQVLPLGPTGYGDSPYQPFSAFAGEPLLISPDRLIEDGLLPGSIRQQIPAFPAAEVDYARVRVYKQPLLEEAFRTFERDATTGQRRDLEAFASAQGSWLDDFALFAALKHAQPEGSWPDWPADIATRQQTAVAQARERLAPAVRFQVFCQYVFFRQWAALRRYAEGRGVRFIGDMPLYVAHDSADCWSHPELFHLKPDGRPAQVAGVPPDYFSATGQLWGNPLYRWRSLAETDYAWWIERLRTALALVDAVRLDHFRGFAAYWAIPADAPTAASGHWRRGPGGAFFSAVRRTLGPLPLIAEDLGLITPDVEALRRRFGLPGMKVLQFAFGGGADNPYLPHNYTRDFVVYTGTHDNDTTAGWFAAASPEERQRVLDYIGASGTDPTWDLIRLAYASVADTAIVPLQDVLGLGGEARMNRPGQLGGNWRWRCTASMLSDDGARRLAALAERYGRRRRGVNPAA